MKDKLIPDYLQCSCAAVLLIVHVMADSPLHAQGPTQPPSAIHQRLRDLGATVKENQGVIVDLRINCEKLTDDDYKRIGTLTTLKSISISGKPMFDRHLEMLSDLKQLEAFQINGTLLTDEGYRHFAAFPKLRRLSLFHPSRDVKAFTGSGLSHLKPLNELRRLTFAGATAGDEAFEAVGQLTQLEEFSQWHNRESPEAIKHLAGLKNLKSLKLGQRLPSWSTKHPPSLTPGTIAEILKMKSLELIDLQEARLDSETLSNLGSLPKLKKVQLKWIDITETEIKELQRKMPNVKIQWIPMTPEEEQKLLVKKLRL